MDYETAMSAASEIADKISEAINKLEDKLNDMHTTQLETKVILDRIYRHGITTFKPEL